MGVVSRLNNLRWEIQLGISTHGIVGVDKDDACHYATIDYPILFESLRRLDLQADDVFVDIGCGKGRVLCCASRYRVAKVMGVEYSAALCVEAVANARRVRGRKSPVAVHQSAAEDFDYGNVTAFFLFNPFGPKTLDLFLRKLGERVAAKARLVFVNASEAQRNLLARHGWIACSEFRSSVHTSLLMRKRLSGDAGVHASTLQDSAATGAGPMFPSRSPDFDGPPP